MSRSRSPVTLFCYLIVACLPFTPALAGISNVPEGWSSQSVGSDTWRVVPSDAKDTFAVRIGPIEQIDGDSKAWFNDSVEQILKNNGAKQIDAPKRDPKTGLYSASGVANRDASPQLVFINSFLDQSGGFGRVSVITAMNSPKIKSYIQQAGTFIGKNAAELKKHKATTATPAKKKAAKKEEDWQPIAAPGKGLDSDDIESLMYEGRGVYTYSGYQYKETVRLLLDDGTVYLGLEIPPNDLDVAASRAREPEKWSEWRKRFGTHQIKDENGQWQDRDIDEIEPIDNDRLDISLIHRTAYTSVGLGGSVFTKTYRFNSDGTFERSRSSLHGTGTMQSTGGFSGSAASSEDYDGRSSSAGGTSETAGSRVGTASQSKQKGNSEFSGRYRIDGYAIELKTDAGTVEHLLTFYSFDNKDKIFINGATFDRPDE